MPDYLVKEATKNDIMRIIRKVDGATGFAVNSPTSLALAPQQPGGRPTPAESPESLPTPQYQGMFWGGVTDGVAAYAFPFAVESVPV